MINPSGLLGTCVIDAVGALPQATQHYTSKDATRCTCNSLNEGFVLAVEAHLASQQDGPDVPERLCPHHGGMFSAVYKGAELPLPIAVACLAHTLC